MSNVRITHLTWSLSTGGAEHVLVDLANAQSRLGAQVSIVIVNRDIEPALLSAVSPSIRVTTLDRPKGSKNPLYFTRLSKAVMETAPDIVHTHRPNLIGPFSVPRQRLCSFLSALSPRPLRLCGEKHLSGVFVTTIHTTGVPVDQLPAYARVFAVSETVAADIVSRCPSVSPVVIPNGIDFSAIRVAPAPDPGKPFRVVQVARLDAAIKGQDILLHALALLNDPSAAPLPLRGEQLFCDFIGDGPSVQELQHLASTLGLSSQVRFLGPLPRREVYERLATCDLMVHPARREGFGLSIVEAMAAGIPVLVPDRGAPYEIVGGDSSSSSSLLSPRCSFLPYGFAFDAGDPASCAQSIRQIMIDRNTPDFARRLAAAREYANARFSIEATARQYLSEYEPAPSMVGSNR